MSTYSPNLRIELITTGTQAGTWGTTTNTNLGTLLEGSVAGYATVTITSTSQALTANNGAADESRLAMLQLTTSGISSAFSVFAPPATKQYTIYNASSYTATIYNSTVLGNTTAAGTGVAIPAGYTMTVWSNGTSFYQQNTYLNSTTLNAPTITGVSAAPTASFGTSTTQLATTAFVQAALQALYPVGTIYTSTVSTIPSTLFGFGTWVAFGAGRVMVGFDATNTLFDTSEETGGYADSTLVSHTHTATSTFTGTAMGNHTHTITDPGHFHTINYQSTLGGANYGSTTAGCATGTQTNSATTGITGTDAASAGTPAGTVATTNTTEGSAAANKNYQPYITVYMWKRTV